MSQELTIGSTQQFDQWSKTRLQARANTIVRIVCTECGLDPVGKCKGCGNVPLCENCGPLCADCLEAKAERELDKGSQYGGDYD